MAKKLTNRQIQSQNTRDRIYKVAIELIKKKGFDSIKISEICKKAGVSVGSFYNYFDSKQSIINENFKMADEYFLNIVSGQLNTTSSIENIKLFFNYYAQYNLNSGLDLIKQFYKGNNLFNIKGRPMQMVLQGIIENGQNSEEIILGMSSYEIVDFLFISIRGVIYDWCLNDGNYDLIEKVNEYTNLLIKSIKISKSH